MRGRRWPLSIRNGVLARVEGGEALYRVCRDAEMPGRETVLNWARIDPGFRAALKAAEAAGRAARRAGGRARAWDEDVAQALVGRLEAGEGLDAALRAPGMPGWRALGRWRKEVPAFDAVVGRAVAREKARNAERSRRRRRDYDAAVGLRICDAVAGGAFLGRLLGAGGGFPCLEVVTRWRRERADFDALLRAALKVGRTRRPHHRAVRAAVKAKVLARLRAGASLHSLAAAADMPCRSTLYRLVRDDPDFAAAVNLACDARDERLADLACDAVALGLRGRLGPAESDAAFATAKARYEQVTRSPGRWRRGR